MGPPRAGLALAAMLAAAAPARARAEAPARPLAPAIIKRVDTTAPEVAITFDACATQTQGYGFDRPVYEVLRREQVPATIFVSGRWVEFHPDVMEELAGDPLIEFANHSYAHPHLTQLATARIGVEIDQTEAVLARYGKRSVAFRPPFGEWSGRVLGVVRDRQLPAVLWDVVSGDPSRTVSAEAIIRNVTRKARAGSIIVFHINGRGNKTAAALPAILGELRARGLRFVHVSALLAGAGVAGAGGGARGADVKDAAPLSRFDASLDAAAAPPAPPGNADAVSAATAPAPTPTTTALPLPVAVPAPVRPPLPGSLCETPPAAPVDGIGTSDKLCP
jgi:peptidoglycan/xylan/chitin deacetylase (PgdA/CDA1 family)